MDWKYFSLLSLFSVLNFLSCATLLCPLRAALAQLPMPAAGLAIYALVLVLVASFTLAAQWLLPAAALRPPWTIAD
jgi:hypothetical protein